ncbi:hypothetical protein BSL78_26477 [Apostichopus japonicus]|uniref:Uncharacterized protein n=1 Tax=Stichopus japonicus TaxID=307972 RepID=A0A2G8JLS0_STIJA|nr:hypothetical protein BSL78_26477 [Apostichopus japonicus]
MGVGNRRGRARRHRGNMRVHLQSLSKQKFYQQIIVASTVVCFLFVAGLVFLLVGWLNGVFPYKIFGTGMVVMSFLTTLSLIRTWKIFREVHGNTADGVVMATTNRPVNVQTTMRTSSQVTILGGTHITVVTSALPVNMPTDIASGTHGAQYNVLPSISGNVTHYQTAPPAYSPQVTSYPGNNLGQVNAWSSVNPQYANTASPPWGGSTTYTTNSAYQSSYGFEQTISAAPSNTVNALTGNTTYGSSYTYS